MTQPKILIHIGANKTASTTFQRNCFIHLNELVYRGEEDPQIHKYQSIIDSIINDDPFYYQNDKTVDFINSFVQERPDCVHLLSYEDISRGYLPTLGAQRFKSLMPQAEILFVIRNQFDAVQSWYASHGAFLRDAPKPHWRRYVSFKNWFQHQLDFKKNSHLEAFNYERIISPFVDSFGKEKIHILFYEEFVQDPFSFCSKLAKLLGLDPNKIMMDIKGKRERKRATRAQFMYQRIFGRLWPIKWDGITKNSSAFERFVDFFLKRGTPYKHNLNTSDLEILNKFYQSGNLYLKNNFDLALEQYGYPLPGKSI